VQQRIVDRLGLRDTGADLDPARRDEYAAGHTALGYGARRITIDHVDTGAMAAATGVYSTARDLVTYASAHFADDERLLGVAAKRQMQHAGWRVEGTESEYGFGVEVTTIGQRRVLGHGGGYPGHITRTYFDPSDRLAISVFTNAIDGPALGLASVGVKLVDLAAKGVGGPTADAPGIDPQTFCGRFATLWGVYDVAALGGRLYQLSPTLVDPTVAPTRLEIVDRDTLRIVHTSGYGSRGETLHVERRDDGTIVSMRGGSGSTAYPLDEFRHALAGRQRVRLGDPLRP
jgi:CubicO group peptidase (beta-lactamase class C family)